MQTNVFRHVPQNSNNEGDDEGLFKWQLGRQVAWHAELHSTTELLGQRLIV